MTVQQILVLLIVIAAAVFLIYRFVKGQGPSQCSGCPGCPSDSEKDLECSERPEQEDSSSTDEDLK